MWIVQAVCEEGYSVREFRAWLESDVEKIKEEIKILFPNCKPVAEIYKPWTKERAETEIAEKAKRLGIPNPLEADSAIKEKSKTTKKRTTKKKE